MNIRLILLILAAVIIQGCATTSTNEQSSEIIEDQQPTEIIVEAPPVVAIPMEPPQIEIAPPPPPPKDPLTIIAVGDIMLGTDFPEDRLPPHGGTTSFSRVADILRDADITFGNAEGVIQDGGEPFKVCKNPKLCYLFRSPASYAQHFADAGFDIVSLANNHARDFGEEGRSTTMALFDQLGIYHSGREGDIASWQYRDYRLAMIAFAPNPGSYNINDIEFAESIVAHLADTHDLVIVSFHGGAEGLDALHVTHENEIYYGEQRGNVVEFSHRVIDAGADLVIGHGPHVPRALELYRDRLIAYSLGNFNTYQGISISGIKGLAPILKVTLDESGRFKSGQIISTRQQRPGGPSIDKTNESALLMQQLTREDFPSTLLQIDDNGNLLRME